MPRLRENVTTNDLCRSYRFWGGGVLSLSKEIGKIRHSTVTLLLTTITEVLTDAHIGFRCYRQYAQQQRREILGFGV